MAHFIRKCPCGVKFKAYDGAKTDQSKCEACRPKTPSVADQAEIERAQTVMRENWR